MFLSGIPGAAADLGLGSVLAASQLKLLAALPPQLRERSARVRDRFHLDAPGWLHENDTPPLLAAVAEAAWSERRLDVRYERANRVVVERVLDPLGLVLKAGNWYVVAAADDGRGPRTYRVSRVRSAAVRDETFTRPDGFDLEQFWAAYQRSYAERIYTATADVRLSPQGRELLFLVGRIPARRARAEMSEPDADGWARTRIPVESLRHGQHALLQLGEHVEVLGPPDLRRLIGDSARLLAGRYSAGPDLGGGLSATSAVSSGS